MNGDAIALAFCIEQAIRQVLQATEGLGMLKSGVLLHLMRIAIGSEPSSQMLHLPNRQSLGKILEHLFLS